MANGIAYIILIAIWSTTPLAIKWSATDLSFVGAIFWRILLSALLALAVLSIRGESLRGYRHGLRFYVVAALGIAPNFLLVYWSAQWISSGLISVIFSTTPFLIGVLSYYWLGRQVFTVQRVIALLIAMLGLVVVFAEQLIIIGRDGAYGVVVMLVSVVIFATSSTYLQKMNTTIPVLQQTTGGLCFSSLFLALVWLLLDGSAPWPITLRGGLSILYLSVFGSLIGFMLYYFLLQRISAYAVSTVGMISPAFALILGVFLAGELLTLQLMIGAGLVLLGLTLYHMRGSALVSVAKRLLGHSRKT